MKENTDEKSLVIINENSIFYKIKSFFRNLFHRNAEISYNVIIEENISSNTEIEDKKSAFIDSIRNIEDEETKLLKLQKEYRAGRIKGEELSEGQIKSLATLYDKQILSLKKSNQIRKQRLLEYRKRLQTNN